MSNGGGSDFLTVALLLFAIYCVFVWIGQLVVMAATAAYFVVLFGTFALTALSLATWKHRVTIGRLSLGPEQSRPFIVRGLIGAALVPAFALFCELFLDVRVPPKWWPHLAAVGYALGSIGIGMIEDGLVGDARDYGPVIDHEARPLLPGPRAATRPSRAGATDLTPSGGPGTGQDTAAPPRTCQCFTFATWDDEEETRGRGPSDVLRNCLSLYQVWWMVRSHRAQRLAWADARDARVARARSERLAEKRLQAMLDANPSGQLGNARLNDPDALRRSGLL